MAGGGGRGWAGVAGGGWRGWWVPPPVSWASVFLEFGTLLTAGSCNRRADADGAAGVGLGWGPVAVPGGGAGGRPPCGPSHGATYGTSNGHLTSLVLPGLRGFGRRRGGVWRGGRPFLYHTSPFSLSPLPPTSPRVRRRSPTGVFPEGENRGREARAGAEIGGKARSPGWNASQGTPGRRAFRPSLPREARCTRPRCSPSGNKTPLAPNRFATDSQENPNCSGAVPVHHTRPMTGACKPTWSGALWTGGERALGAARGVVAYAAAGAGGCVARPPRPPPRTRTRRAPWSSSPRPRP